MLLRCVALYQVLLLLDSLIEVGILKLVWIIPKVFSIGSPNIGWGLLYSHTCMISSMLIQRAMSHSPALPKYVDPFLTFIGYLKRVINGLSCILNRFLSIFDNLVFFWGSLKFLSNFIMNCFTYLCLCAKWWFSLHHLT